MYQPISVCIRARNEERAIAGSLSSILEKPQYGGEIEVIVCANGCEDRTEEIVQEFAQRHSNLRLISTESYGLPHTWNTLRGEASHNLIVFMDSDVVAEELALTYLQLRMSISDYLLVGASHVKYTSDCDPLTRLLSSPSGNAGCISGGLYLMDRVRFSTHMSDLGYDEMPDNLLGDDIWLSLVAGKENWCVDPNAKFLHRPYHWSEHLKMSMRRERIFRQLREEYPKLLNSERAESQLERIRRQYGKLKKVEKVGLKLKHLVGFGLVRLINLEAKRRVSREEPPPGLKGFETASKSRELIKI
jgi:glycosyltransferase involved in cell wall biosynthesis